MCPQTSHVPGYCDLTLWFYTLWSYTLWFYTLWSYTLWFYTLWSYTPRSYTLCSYTPRSYTLWIFTTDPFPVVSMIMYGVNDCVRSVFPWPDASTLRVEVTVVLYLQRHSTGTVSIVWVDRWMNR